MPLVLAACGIYLPTRTTEPFFSTQSCTPPCWESLTPGASTIDDVRRVLATLSGIPANSVSEGGSFELNGHQVSQIQWCWTPTSPRRCGYAVLINGRFSGIGFPPAATITFASAVQELGPPDQVAYEQVMWTSACRVSLEWQDVAISATASVRDSCPSGAGAETGLPVSPLLQVNTLYYATPDALHPFDTGSIIRPWAGFAEGLLAYSDLVPGGPSTWVLPVIALVAAVVLALAARNLNAAAAGFMLAAIGACVPTWKLQLSDVIFPTCGAYFANTALGGAFLSLLIVALRGLFPRPRSRSAPDASHLSE